MDTEKTSVARDAQGAAVAYPENPGSATAPKGPADSQIVAVRRGGRKKVVTLERRTLICKLLAEGSTEKAACLRAGIGESAWGEAKKADVALRAQIAGARDRWAELRHRQHMAARQESQWHRSAGREALKPTPTKQANMVVWHLVRRVSLDWGAIPEHEIGAACERFSMARDTWERQERAFGLMKKVYAQRAKMRGEQSARVPRFDLSAWNGGAGIEVNDDGLARFYP